MVPGQVEVNGPDDWLAPFLKAGGMVGMVVGGGFALSPILGPVMTPAVRRLARAVGADLSRVPRSGEGARITRDDVLEMVRRANRAARCRSS